MSDSTEHRFTLPSEQQAIRNKCFHPSGTFVEFPIQDIETSIPERFEKIVRLYPDRIAVETAAQIVTYAELNAMANRLARAILAQQGDKPEPVGLLFEKGVPLIAAMLGVLKAGKFFVLLDKSFPKARIATILQDSQARSVITRDQNVSLAKELRSSGCRLLEFESIDCAVSAEDLKLRIPPRAFASIFYTSGSTGQPKGVVWDHRSLLHLTMLRTIEIRACEFDRIAFLTSGTANAVTNCLFSLLNGAALLAFDVQKEGVARLARWLLKERISICLISSPLFRNLCETLTGEERFSELRIIRLRSETVYKTDVDLYKKYFSPTCIFVTGLSSSETGQLSTYMVDHNTEIAGNEVPVGYAVEGKGISLLDDMGKEVGFNEVGEIAARSRYFPPGYWRRPDLTTAKFKPDPVRGDQQVCLTGDLGLMLPDGCLLHRGRRDFRVKVRGYGVELAEVEKALLEHPIVKEAVVVARKNELGEARLVAYYASVGQPSPSVSELRGFLKKKLPDYMIPPSLVMVDAIPLTANGKVDRRALPDPKSSRAELDTAFVPAKNSTEEKLVKICAEVLSLEKLGIHDNFFDLGGNSLVATRVISRIRDDFQVDLSLSHFFETPTVAALGDHIERARLAQHTAETVPIRPASRDRQLFLSFAQQRLWFLDQLQPGSSAYNFSSVFKLKGKLNVIALEQSFNELIKRHETLRTVFHAVDGSPFQIILPFMTIKLRQIDLRDIVSNKERDSETHRLSTSEVEQPFDLTHGPLLRVTLMRITEDEFRLLLTMHHIVSDGWSMGVLFRELSAVYDAFSKGHPSPLVELRVQYADFAQWQRQQLVGERLEKQLAYWKEQLENVPTQQLPTDRPRPLLRTDKGARRHFVLSDDLSAALKSLSNQYGVTLFMVLLAAYQILLQRSTGQNDIVIGAPVAGRNNREIEGLIGFFLNMLVLRVDLTGDPTFLELLARVRKTCLEAYSHQDLPFDRLVEELHPNRNLTHHPLFQVTFGLQNTPRCPLQLCGVSAIELEREGGVRFDLHLFMEEEERHLQGWIDYSKDLFNGETIDRMIGHFQTLLEGIVSHPEWRISDLPILTEAEKHQVLVEWNDTKKDYPTERCLQHLFEAQVDRTPNAVAVTFGNQRLTYQDLNSKANQLAHYLQKLGVGDDMLVGICLERSLEMVIALLGVLKAGGAYLPLDSSYPAARLDYILRNSGAAVLLTRQELAQRLPPFEGRIVCLDQDRQKISGENGENPSVNVDASSLAYVIYTSGSTGSPKGVMISHGAVCNHMMWMHEAFPLDKEDRVAQRTAFSFDASIWEFFAPLISGAQLVLAPPEASRDPACLVHFLQKERITILQLVPTLLQVLLDQGMTQCTSLRRVFCGGEPLSGELCARFRNQLAAPIINLYGPTETTIDATAYACSQNNSPGWVAIGRPIGNTQVYILDTHLLPVPIGVVGELHIGGDGLARGYLNRGDLTAEKFIPNPFSDDPRSRLYKTGDLVRYLPEGNIEFMGRLDDQVKIRGFRIELGEIESVLSQHPTIQQAVVLAREDTPGDTRLVAYVVARTGAPFDVSEVKKYLKQKFLEYMIPSALELLNELPLTPNGKVDRGALPAPDRSRRELATVYRTAGTPTEETLAVIWHEVLKLDRVGIDDNFFDLGGHSLLATQVVARMSKAFSIELPLRQMFESPTIAEIAAILEQSQAKRASDTALEQMLREVEVMTEEEAHKMTEI